jgi:nitrate/nitrite transporter NarK
MALANMAGNLGAFLCPMAVGGILDATDNQWSLVLFMLAAVAFAGGVCWLLLDPDAKPSR